MKLFDLPQIYADLAVPQRPSRTQPSRSPTSNPSKSPTDAPTKSPTPPPTPPPSAAPTYPIEAQQPVTSYQLSVESIEHDGRYFWVSASNFPVTINPNENSSYRTTVRVNNLDAVSRNKDRGLVGVVFQYFEDSDMVRGHYNPHDYSEVDDFAAGHNLEIEDYIPFTNRDCDHADYGIASR